jgi:hypothetical protein
MRDGADDLLAVTHFRGHDLRIVEQLVDSILMGYLIEENPELLDDPNDMTSACRESQRDVFRHPVTSPRGTSRDDVHLHPPAPPRRGGHSYCGWRLPSPTGCKVHGERRLRRRP